MLVVGPSSIATSPPVMQNLMIIRFYDLLGCIVGVFFGHDTRFFHVTEFVTFFGVHLINVLADSYRYRP